MLVNTPLTKRREFFDSPEFRYDAQEKGLPTDGARYSCPCCGYPTLRERGGDEICKLCWWEDDGQDVADADEVRGGPNHHYSLTEAQYNFDRYLVMYPPEHDTRIGGADSEEVLELKRNLIAAFDSLMSNPYVNRVWNKIDEIEKSLNKARHDRVRDYEAKMRAGEMQV